MECVTFGYLKRRNAYLESENRRLRRKIKKIGSSEKASLFTMNEILSNRVLYLENSRLRCLYGLSPVMVLIVVLLDVLSGTTSYHDVDSVS